MNSCERTAAITAIANALACRLTQDELELFGGFSDPAGRYPSDHCNPKEHMLQVSDEPPLST